MPSRVVYSEKIKRKVSEALPRHFSLMLALKRGNVETVRSVIEYEVSEAERLFDLAKKMNSVDRDKREARMGELIELQADLMAEVETAAAVAADVA